MRFFGLGGGRPFTVDTLMCPYLYNRYQCITKYFMLIFMYNFFRFSRKDMLESGCCWNPNINKIYIDKKFRLQLLSR